MILEAVLLDFANTVVQYDRPQMQGIHVALAEHLSKAVAPIGAATLGRAMDHVCPLPAQDHERSYATDRPDFTIEHLAQVGEILAPAVRHPARA